MPDLHETINQFLEGSIASIGRDPVIESKSITANGTYTAPEGVDGYSPITVNVPTPTPVIESKSITANGTYTAPEGVDGYSPITVNVPTPTPVIESKSITANGTYTAPEGVDGYSPITVNVPLPQNAYLLKSVNTPTPIASFSDGEEMVMPSLKVAIEPQQEGSGDPSPTNIRPIRGWSNCVISVANAITDPTVEHTYTIDLDGTRYGGELDVVSGTMTADRVYYQFNNSKTYTITGSARLNDRWITSITNIPNVSDEIKSRSGVISSISPRDAEYTTITVSGFCKNLSSPYPIFNINDSDSGLTASSSATDIANAVNTFLHQHTPQIVYELATPITIQLSPTTVKSLLGQNNVWADTGDITDAEYFSKEE